MSLHQSAASYQKLFLNSKILYNTVTPLHLYKKFKNVPYVFASFLCYTDYDIFFLFDSIFS